MGAMYFEKFKKEFARYWKKTGQALPSDEELLKLFTAQVVVREYDNKEAKRQAKLDRRTAHLADVGKPLEPVKEPPTHPGFNRCTVKRAYEKQQGRPVFSGNCPDCSRPLPDDISKCLTGACKE